MAKSKTPYIPKINELLRLSTNIPGTYCNCFYCKENHLFTDNLEKKLPYLLLSKDNKFRGFMYDISKKKEYNQITIDNIKNKMYPEEYAIYWSDDLKIFNYMHSLLIDNNELVDVETINFLKSKILCLKWWDDYLNLLFDINEEISNKYYILLKNKKYNFSNYLEKVKEKNKKIIEYDYTIFCCDKCKQNHKYSRFPVNISKNNVNQPILIFNNEENIFRIKICNPITEEYNNIIDENFNKNNVKDAIFWTNGINLLDNIMIILENNIDNINKITIKELAENIYCSLWWDNLLYHIGMGYKKKYDNYYEYVNILLEYKKIYINTVKNILFKYINVIDYIINYNFKNFDKILKLFKEDKRRNTEKIFKEEVKEESNKKILKAKEEEENLKNLEIEEILNFENKATDENNFEDIFKKKLNKNRKGEIKLLASISPDANIMADLTMKIGEISKLQEGIDNEEKMKKIKIWEYYLKQEQEIKDGIKYKNPEFKKKNSNDNLDLSYIPDNNNKIKITMSNTQKQQLSRIYDKFKKEKKNEDSLEETFILDGWQSKTIDNIKLGNSCLIIGPTSGGKTYVMMAGLNNIINSKENKNIVYISPSVELARQTYANIKRTFPTRKISLITTQFIVSVKESNIFIGTAHELILYFINNKITFHIGIFDEIHVASKLYFDESNSFDRYRAMAYSRLLVLCKDQVIAASATIKNEEDMCIFIANKMNEDRVEDSYISYKDIVIIKYHDRVVPLQEYRYINNKIINLDRDNNGIEINNNETIDDFQPSAENTFLLLISMKNRNMIPAIFFEDSDDIVWKTYIDLINFLEINEQNDYKDYHQMIENINKHIIKYNNEFNNKINDIPEKNNMDSSRLSFGKSDDIKRSLKILRTKTINIIISDSKNILERSIKNLNKNNDLSQSLVDKNEILKIINDLYEYSDDYKKIKNIRLTFAHIEMINIIKSFISSIPDQVEMIFQIDINKGSYYRFSKSSCGIDQLKAMREPGDDEDNWKQRKKMEALAKAQNIKIKDIEGIIDIIMRGLEFGISIIISSLPFVLQNIILENIRTKNMGIVFSSEDMSMGINYPLRSVNIRSPNKINAAKLIQMSGRCGRRGKDTQAHVIYWGIKNAHEAHDSFISPLVYQRDFIFENNKINDGLMITNHQDIALELGIIHYIKYFKDIVKVNEPVKKIKEPKKTVNLRKFVKFEKQKKEPEFDFQNDDYNKLILDKRVNDVKLFRSQYLEPVIKSLGKQIGLEENEIDELSKMICDIDNDVIKESYYNESFKKSRKVKSIICMMIELYNYYAACTNLEFLEFIESIVNILKICEYRLIKLSN